MDHAPPDRAAHPSRSAGTRPPDMSADGLSRLFGLPDLPARLAAVDDRITDVLGHDGALLGQASVRVAQSGGKRLRPLFTIVTAAVGGVFDERVVDAAAAVELVQVGSLVHDDILDEADTRRGRPTINAVEGVNHAVLAGDYILARAAELAAGVSQVEARLVAVALGELCEGQVLEMRDAYDRGRTVEAHLASMQGKTAALFECACRLGADCGGLGGESGEALARLRPRLRHGVPGARRRARPDRRRAQALGKPTGNDIAAASTPCRCSTRLTGRRRRPAAPWLAAPTGPRPAGRPAHAAEADPAPSTSCASRAPSPRPSVAMDRYADEARRAVAHLNQTTDRRGLDLSPAPTTWALDAFMDDRYLEVP